MTRYTFDFDIINFHCVNGDVPSSPSYETYLSQLIRFAKVCNKVEDFNDRNSIMSRKLLKQDFLYHKLMKTFDKFYNRQFYLVKHFYSSLINLMKKVKCQINGVSLQPTASLITFLKSPAL